MLGISGVLLVLTALVCVFLLALDLQRGREREERHQLKNELAAARLLLMQHGIDFPERKP